MDLAARQRSLERCSDLEILPRWLRGGRAEGEEGERPARDAEVPSAHAESRW
jgi:hypothetical protein